VPAASEILMAPFVVKKSLIEVAFRELQWEEASLFPIMALQVAAVRQASDRRI
jgi:hypothetical protein